MKKLAALVMVVCMMFGTVVLGNAEERVLLQDRQAPKIVTTTNEANETIVANICDAQGNVIAQVKDDGSVMLTDVNQRKKLENEVVVKRLTDTYLGVMDGVHHSDVTCRLHEHEVKVDINAVLASLNHEMNAHDLVMYELFDIMIADDVAAELVDGNYLELTLEVAEGQGIPLIIIFSADGVEWQVIPHEDAGDNSQFVLKLTESGAVALLCDGTEMMGIGEDVEEVITEVPGDEIVTEVPGGNFTPSASGKPAPTVVTVTTTEGEVYVGYIYSSVDEDVKIPVPNKNYVITTAVSERGYTMDIQTYEHLEWAYDSILEAADVGDLPADNHEGTIASDIDAVLAGMNLDLTHDDLVVKDLFEVTAYGDYVHYLYDDNYYLQITFDAKMNPGQHLVVIHSPDSEHWHIHDPNEVEVNADGTVTLNMYDLGAVAFLVEATDDAADLNTQGAVQSPN